jgi:hypothetical protein
MDVDIEDSSSRENDPSILEYARFYGLTIDYLSSRPLDEFPWRDAPIQIEEVPGLFEINAGIARPVPERLTIARGALTALTQVLNQPDFGVDLDIFSNPHRLRDVKLELPLLRTDHEWDMRELTKRPVPELDLPPALVDEEQDEGLSWPLRYRDLPKRLKDEMDARKLAIPRGTLEYLHNVLKYHESGGPGLEAIAKPYKRVRLELLLLRNHLTRSTEPGSRVCHTAASTPLPGDRAIRAAPGRLRARAPIGSSR